jgi:EmrB/QacA subfamily drug resistance transporter
MVDLPTAGPAPGSAGAGLRMASARGRWVLFATVLGSGIAFLDGTVVNVALPAIGRDLDASLAGLQWTVNGYTLSLAALILLGGSLGDRFGRRRIFVVGVVWFALASALCALAPTVEVLVLSRVLQGVGGALLTPGSLAILQASFHPEDRARAIGAWSGLTGTASAIGPFVGGWLVQSASWRWVFLVNVPLAALVLVATRHVPESRDESASHHFDIPGAVLGALSLAGLTYALIEAPELGGTSPAVILSAVTGVLAGIAFVVVERRTAEPMLPVRVFKERQFTAVNLVTFAVYAALGAVFFFVVVNLQVVAGFSPIASGVALIPVTLLMLALSARAGSLAQRIGPRLPMTVGPAIAAVSLVMLSQVGEGANYWTDVLPGSIVLGLGLSATVAPLTAAALGALEVRHAGLASGVNNAVARAAGLLAIAALPLVVGLSGSDYEEPAEFVQGYEAAMLICAGLLLIGAVLAWLTVRNTVQLADTTAAAGTTTEAACREQPAEGGHYCGVDAPPLESADLRSGDGI